MTVNPSASIQDAVDSATAGDVITVNAGTYDEDVTVDKRLTLRGEGNAIVNGGFLLGGAAAGATVENFIVNQGTDSVAINVNSVNDAVVRGCTVSGGIYGIYIQSATNCTVEGCTVSNVENNGIHLESAGQSQVLDNQVSGCGGGFSGFGILLYTNSPDCLISGNTVQGCTDRGIQIQSGCQGAVIESNICSGNNGGLRVSGCTGTPTVLRDNTVLGDHNTAVGLEGVDSVIVENVTARDGKNGIFLADAENITLTNSTFTGFTGYGLFVFSGSYATNSLIANNLFNNTQNVLIPDKSVTTGTRWNTTQTAGENIRGGPFLGGNLWLTPEGTGFSQTRADFDLDGICDEGYDLGNGCTDSLPLQNGGPSSAFSVTPSSAMVGVPLAFNDTSLGDPASWTWTFDEEDPITITDPADRNITRTYDTADTYQASLKVENEFGTNTTTCTLDVTPYTIQGAVDAAAPGDVVLVPAGEYTESVTVKKNITLRGSEGAVLNGRIKITSGADGATVEHLTVNGDEGDMPIYLSGVSGCTVRDNTVTGGYSGIYLCSGSSDCLVSGNHVEDYSQNGISLTECGSGNEVVANTCSGGCYGFHIEDCTGPNTLRDNTVFNANGINLPNPGPVVVENVTMHIKPGGRGVIFFGNDALTLTNSTITGAYQGLCLSPDSGLEHMLIANNLFNNTQNLHTGYGTDLSGTRWNTTKTEGTNIGGGPYLGGNLWLTPDGTGFSETHLDLDGDGICDESYDLGAGCTDSLPLHTCLPTANFTVTPAGGSIPLEVQFADASSGVNPRTYSWDFGDATSDQAAPSHTFTTNGTHQVSLTVTNDFGSDTTTRTVTALEPPAAVISANLTEGNAPLAVAFTDDSTGCVFERLWTFADDGATSTDATLSHTFENPGTYTVSLNASNTYAFDEATVEVVVLAAPEANFTFTPTAGNTPLTVTFNETSTGDVDTWAWDFGDGSWTVSGRNVTHTFNERGTFPVTLTASNAFGSNATTRTVTVHAAPVAGFDLNVSEGNDPLTVLVTNTSTGDFTQCVLDFGDGSGTVVMTGETAAHTFDRPDTYTVMLNASNAYGFNRTTSTVTVHAAPVAGFDLNVSEGNDPLTVLVTNTSTGDFTQCVLDFGDGSGEVAMTGPTAAHTFDEPNTYTVTLNASNAYGFNRTTSTVTVLPSPVANFMQSADEGNAPLTVAFTDASTGNVTSWQWDFGDGNVSTEQNPSHEYVTPGTYTVQLNASNTYGFNLSDSTVNVLPPPAANFTQSAEEGNAPLEVTFTDASTGNVTTWQWDFGDGNVSTEQNPSHEYVTPGTYAVQLNASNAYGFSLSDSTVTILAPPAANFTQSAAEGNAPLEVVFTDTSTGDITDYHWSFGDGATSTEASPVHEYTEKGEYTVELKVNNAYGFDTTTSVVTVLAPPSADFTQSADEGNAPLEVVFTDASTGDITDYHWSFGDGATSTEASPVHEYTEKGEYTVELNASNAYGFDTTTSTVMVLPAPEANFTQSPDEGNAPLSVAFTDASTGDVTAWAWDFGDGNVSTAQNPSHEYVTPGTYTVELNASNVYGFDTTTSVVTVFSPPVADFKSKTGVGGDLRKVTFTDTSSGHVTTWHWAFGDGATSTEEHPVHTYEKYGAYTVTLTVQNAYETSTTNGTVTLTAPSSSGGRSPASAGTVSHLPAGGHASFEVRDSAIREVEVTTSEAVSDLLVTIESTAKPNRIEAPAEAVYEYDEVMLYHTTDDALAGADLDFTVTKAWLEEQGGGPERVVLYRYHDDAWHALPTRMVGEDDHRYSFVAESPGFSLFAIGVDESSTPAPTLTPAEPVTTVPVTTAPPTPTTPTQTPLPWGCAAFAAAGAAVATRRR